MIYGGFMDVRQQKIFNKIKEVSALEKLASLLQYFLELLTDKFYSVIEGDVYGTTSRTSGY